MDTVNNADIASKFGLISCLLRDNVCEDVMEVISENYCRLAIEQKAARDEFQENLTFCVPYGVPRNLCGPTSYIVKFGFEYEDLCAFLHIGRIGVTVPIIVMNEELQNLFLKGWSGKDWILEKPILCEDVWVDI